MKKILDTNREEICSNENYTNCFLQIMSYGEKTIKVIILGFIASINEGVHRQRNSLERSALKATGLGTWVELIDRINETSPLMRSVALVEFQELLDEHGKNTWQYIAVSHLNDALNIVLNRESNLRRRVTMKQWFDLFVQLRNKTRGHGDIPSAMQEAIAEKIFESIELIRNNLSVLKRQWAYLRKTQKQKFHVQGLSEDYDDLRELSTTAGAKNYSDLQDGVYIFWEKPVLVNLVKTVEPDTINVGGFDRDFTYPNDKWNRDDTYEAISFLTGKIYKHSCHEYLVDPVYLPPSETDPLGEFSVIGESYTNMPDRRTGYVKRSRLEDELLNELYKEDTRTVISLIGRGGVGKTWLTLEVAHQIAEKGTNEKARFGCIVWFSSRDVDLTEDGYTLVKPSTKNLQDIACQYVTLVNMNHLISNKEKDNAVELLGEHLCRGYDEFPGPILFIFDNFETVDDKLSVYKWLENSIRNPNKILITSREHDFRADYPIEILGMEKVEFDEMIQKLCDKHGYWVSKNELNELYETTSGHPYIANLIMSYRIRTGEKEPSKLLLQNPNVFRMLFDRSFNKLSREAQELFIALGKWNSGYIDYAISGVFEAVSENSADWNAALEELENLSMVESRILGDMGNRCYFLPIAAQLFCAHKIRMGRKSEFVASFQQELRKFGVISEISLKDDNKIYLTRYLRHYIDSPPSTDFTVFKTVISTISLLYPKLSLLIYHAINKSPHVYSGLNLRGLIENYMHCCSLETEYEPGWLALMDMLDQENSTGELLDLISVASESKHLSISLASSCANLCNKCKKQFVEIDELLYFRCSDFLYDFMQSIYEELSADDLSRLAWLALNRRTQDRFSAKRFAEEGLLRDPLNIFCRNICERL